MAEPVYIACGDACTVTVVHELALPPLQLSLEDGAQISLAILLVWAVAWAFRQVIRLIQSTGTDEGENL